MLPVITQPVLTIPVHVLINVELCLKIKQTRVSFQTLSSIFILGLWVHSQGAILFRGLVFNGTFYENICYKETTNAGDSYLD